MTMSVSRYHEFDYWFDCWEILPGQLGNKLLIQWCLSLWQAFERKRKGVLDAREMWRVHEEGGRDFNIYLVDFYDAKNNSLPAGISLTPSLTFLLHQKPLSLSIEMPATQAKWCHSICLPAYAVKNTSSDLHILVAWVKININCLIVERLFVLENPDWENGDGERKYKRWNNGAVKPWD